MIAAPTVRVISESGKGDFMIKEQKTARELEAMILNEMNDSSLQLSVRRDPTGWHATPLNWASLRTEVIEKTLQIADRLRAQYDLKES